MAYMSDNERLVARAGYAGVDGLSFDQVKSFASDLIKQGKGLYEGVQQQKGATAAYREMAQQQIAAQRATPGWVWPVVLGGAGVIAFLLLRPRATRP